MSLQKYDIDIIYKAGSTNRNTDALSRICVNNANVILFDCELSEKTIRKKQQNDPVLLELRKIIDGKDLTVKRSTKLATLVSKIDDLYINDNDIIYRANNKGTIQVALPPSLRETVFELLQKQPYARHLGAEKTEKRFADNFYYPNVKPTQTAHDPRPEFLGRRRTPL